MCIKKKKKPANQHQYTEVHAYSWQTSARHWSLVGWGCGINGLSTSLELTIEHNIRIIINSSRSSSSRKNSSISSNVIKAFLILQFILNLNYLLKNNSKLDENLKISYQNTTEILKHKIPTILKLGVFHRIKVLLLS